MDTCIISQILLPIFSKFGCVLFTFSDFQSQHCVSLIFLFEGQFYRNERPYYVQLLGWLICMSFKNKLLNETIHMQSSFKFCSAEMWHLFFSLQSWFSRFRSQQVTSYMATAAWQCPVTEQLACRVVDTFDMTILLANVLHLCRF